MTDLKSNNEFDSLEAFFHERLKDASFAPAEESWKQIEAELELMDKQKRKRRFIWFFSSGLVLLAGLAALWFFVPDGKFMAKPVAQKKVVPAVAENKIESKKEITANDQNKITEPAQTEHAAAENKTDEINLQPAGEKNVVVAQKRIAEPANISANSAAGSSQRIQLAACSKKANPAIFNKVPYKIIEVQGADGLIRYFADVAVSAEALNTIQEAGFARAFVKKNYDAGNNAVTLKDEGTVENNFAYVAANTAKHAPLHTMSKGNTSSVTPAVATNKSNTITSFSSAKELPTSNTYTTDPAITEVIPNPNYKPEPPAATSGNKVENNTGNSNSTPGSEPVTTNPAINQNTTPAGETKNNELIPPPAEIKTDSLPPAFAANENKPDSISKKTEPADSTKKPVADLTPPPFTPEWALLLVAGPNIFTSGAQSNLYNTSGESQPVTVSTALKVQFKPFRKISFSGGLNYMQLSSSQATTQFLFNKHQTSDHIFYSAFGPMAVPMSTVEQGYTLMAPIDTFACKYSQNSKLNMVNIPLEVNYHFVNRSRIGLFVGLGANSSFAVSQQGTLTLHKENLENKVSYNSVTVNRFSMSLIFSLGCDVRIGKKLYLTFVPSYRYGLTNLSATGGTTFAPAYFSGNAGLKFKF